MTRIVWWHRYAVRLGVALALAGVLGQPVGALAFGVGGGGALDNAVVIYTSAPLPTGGQFSTLSADGTWQVRTPYNVPGANIAGPAWTAPPALPPPPIGTSCHVNYSPGISLDHVVGPYRIASWKIPSAAFGTFDANQAATGYFLLDPHATTYDTITPDGTVNLVNNTSALPGSALLSQVITNMPNHGSVVTYVMTGKIAAALTSNICVIDSVVLQGRSSGQPWCNGQVGTGCVPPSVTLVAPPAPPCQGPACIPPITSVISLQDLINRAKSKFTDGGTVVASPRANMELVQLLATFTLQGLPVDTPTQYLTVEVPVFNGGTSVGVASYQVRIGYQRSDWYFDNLESGVTQLLCQAVTQCSTTQLTIGRFALRVVDNFSVDFRSAYYGSYPGGDPVVTPWQSLGGFQLCAGSAGAGLPSCGPGVNPVIFGQVEAVPVS